MQMNLFNNDVVFNNERELFGYFIRNNIMYHTGRVLDLDYPVACKVDLDAKLVFDSNGTNLTVYSDDAKAYYLNQKIPEDWSKDAIEDAMVELNLMGLQYPYLEYKVRIENTSYKKMIIGSRFIPYEFVTVYDLLIKYYSIEECIERGWISEEDYMCSRRETLEDYLDTEFFIANNLDYTQVLLDHTDIRYHGFIFEYIDNLLTADYHIKNIDRHLGNVILLKDGDDLIPGPIHDFDQSGRSFMGRSDTTIYIEY